MLRKRRAPESRFAGGQQLNDLLDTHSALIESYFESLVVGSEAFIAELGVVGFHYAVSTEDGLLTAPDTVPDAVICGVTDRRVLNLGLLSATLRQSTLLGQGLQSVLVEYQFANIKSYEWSQSPDGFPELRVLAAEVSVAYKAVDTRGLAVLEMVRIRAFISRAV